MNPYSIKLAALMNSTLAKAGGLPNNVNDQRLNSTVGNLQQRMQQANVPVPEPQRQASAVTKLFEFLDRPRNAVANALAYTQGGSGGNAMQGFLEGLKYNEVTRGSDLLERVGMDRGIGRAVLGFGMDIGLDPLTYLGGFMKQGLSAGIGKGMAAIPVKGAHGSLAGLYTAGKAGAKAAVRKIPLGVSTAGKAAKTVGSVSDDLGEWMGRSFSRAYLPEFRYADVQDLGPLRNAKQKIDSISRDVSGSIKQATMATNQHTLEPLLKETMARTGMNKDEAWEYLNKMSSSVEHGNTVAALYGREGQAISKELNAKLGGKRLGLMKSLQDHHGVDAKQMDLLAGTMFGKPVSKLTEAQLDAVADAIRDTGGYGKSILEEAFNAKKTKLVRKQGLTGRAAAGTIGGTNTNNTLMEEFLADHRKQKENLNILKSFIPEELRDAAAKGNHHISKEEIYQLAQPKVEAVLKEMNIGDAPDPAMVDLYERFIKPRNDELMAEFEIDGIENYLTHLYDNTPEEIEAAFRKAGYWEHVTAKTANRKPRAGAFDPVHFGSNKRIIPSDDFAEHVLGLKPIRDIRTKMVTYEMASARSRVRKDLINHLASETIDVRLPNGTIKTQALISKKKIKGYVRGSDVLSGVPELKGKWVHPEVGHSFSQVDNALTNVPELHDFLDKVNWLTRKWKGMVTGPNPGYHVNNFVGNIYVNDLAGGIGLKEYSDALMSQTGKDVLLDLGEKGISIRKDWYDLLFQTGSREAGEDVVVKQLTGKQFKDLYELSGATFGDFGEAVHGTSQFSALEAAKKAVGAGAPVTPQDKMRKLLSPVKTGLEFGEQVETNARMAHILGKVREGKTLDEAIESTMKYLFDYNDLTKFEKNVIRPIVPFYTWTRKSIPLHLGEMAQHPQKYMKYFHAMEASRKGFGVDDENMPEWLREQSFGTPIDGVLATPSMPVNVLGRLNSGSAMAMVNPLIRTPLELYFNTQAFNQQPIEQFEGQTKPSGILNWSPPAKLAYAISQMGVTRNPVVRATSAMWDDNRTDKLKNQFSMGLFRDFDPDDAARSQQYRYRDQLQDYRQVLEQRGIDLPELQRSKMTPQQARLLLAQMMQGR